MDWKFVRNYLLIIKKYSEYFVKIATLVQKLLGGGGLKSFSVKKPTKKITNHFKRMLDAQSSDGATLSLYTLSSLASNLLFHSIRHVKNNVKMSHHAQLYPGAALFQKPFPLGTFQELLN